MRSPAVGHLYQLAWLQTRAFLICPYCGHDAYPEVGVYHTNNCPHQNGTENLVLVLGTAQQASKTLIPTAIGTQAVTTEMVRVIEDALARLAWTPAD